LKVCCLYHSHRIRSTLSTSAVVRIYKSLLARKLSSGLITRLTVYLGQVDVGSHSSVSVALINNKLYGLEVHGEGYCWNTEVRNKRSTPLVVRHDSNCPFDTLLIILHFFLSAKVLHHQHQAF